MQAHLIEINRPGNRGWMPIGIAGVSATWLSATDVLDRIRAEKPQLANYSIRLRRFVRMPGVYVTETANFYEASRSILLVID